MDRRFVDLTSEQVSALLEASTMPWFGQSRGIDWTELLRSRRITIISEAGSGKTYECQSQQRRLFGEGQPAFFFELSELARSEAVGSLLTPEELSRVEVWHAASDEIATFFLDAYDELRLTRGRFRTALTRLRAFVGPNLDRIRLIVTSRPVPFERELLGQLFPLSEPRKEARTFVDDVMGTADEQVSPATDKNPLPMWRTVCLTPLDEPAIRALVTGYGLTDVEAFISDLRSRDAFDFARRPQDLIELCQDWREHRRIRVHRDQVITNINLKLKPRTDRDEAGPLSEAKAREGAGTLALAVLLMKSMTIRHSTDLQDEDAAEPCVDPTRLLPTWTQEERRTLLERPLFSYASYGRVRFHHRSVLEFLAAERLQALIRAGMSRRAVKRLLFARTAQGLDVIRPSLRSVAAWLSLHDADVFREVCQREPENLICLGDPSSLSIEQRKTALRAFVDGNRLGTWRGHHVPRIQTRRFADHALGPAVRQLWDSGIVNGEMREFLLELAATTPLPEMSDPAVDIFMDRTAPDGERLDALRTIVALNDPRLPQLTSAMAAEPMRWSSRVLRYAVIDLFPQHLFGDQLRSVLLALKPLKATIDPITWNWPELIQRAPLSAPSAAELRQMLHDLTVEAASWHTNVHRLLTTRPHLVPGLAAICLKELSIGPPPAGWMNAAIAAVQLMSDREYDEDRPVGSLRRALDGLSADDRARAFWTDNALLERFGAREEPWSRYHDLVHDGVISLDPERDRDWVMAAVADRERPEAERHVALHMALRQTSPGRLGNDDYWAELSASVADNVTLSNELASALKPYVPDPREFEWQKKSRKRKAAHDRKVAKDRKSWEDFRLWILSDPEAAFAEKVSYNTCWNLWTGMRRGQELREEGWDRAFIETHFNPEIADRLRRAMMGHWRDVNPPLEYERPPEERGTFYLDWRFALAGVYAEAEDPSWAQTLSSDEAAKAARIAKQKLNGLPEWLVSLAAIHPETVERTLGPDLSAQLHHGSGWSDYLQALRDCAPELRALFVPRIRAGFEEAIGRNEAADGGKDFANLLRQAILVLLAHDDPSTNSFLEGLAADALLGPMEHYCAITWAQTLLRLNPERGTLNLERLFRGEPAPDKLMKETWIAAIFGDRHGRGISVDFGSERFTPDILLRLVLLAYAQVQVADDVHHEGTYSPDTRDDAQTGRNAILSALLDREGQEAWQAKLSLAEDPLLAHFRDRALALAREKSASEADRVRLTEIEVAGIVTRFEAPPKTREDMAALLADRLDDIEELLLADISPRELWAGIERENLLRREVARELSRMSNGLYVVSQESVTADEKETDIRLVSMGADLEGVIELKRAEGFSGRVLLNTIFDQLVQKYLAPQNRRTGLLVISVATKEHFEHPETSARLTPEELLLILKAEAIRIERRLGHEVSLDVRLLDLRPRLKVG